jgi:hypothetical protein
MFMLEVHPRTGHKGPEGEQRYSFALSLNLVLGGGWVVIATLLAFQYPSQLQGTQLSH